MGHIHSSNTNTVLSFRTTSFQCLVIRQELKYSKKFKYYKKGGDVGVLIIIIGEYNVFMNHPKASQF